MATALLMPLVCTLLAGGGDSPADVPLVPLVSPVAHLRRRDDGVHLAVIDLRAKTLDPARAAALTRAAATGISELAGVRVISGAPFERRLGSDLRYRLAACASPECIAAVGIAADVDYLVTGVVSEVAGTASVAMNLVDVRAAATTNRVAATWSGAPEELPALVRAAAMQLVAGPSVGSLTAELHVTVNLAGAWVNLDGKLVGTSPLAAPLQVAGGVHTLRVSKPDVAPFEVTFVASPRQARELAVKLAPEPDDGAWWGRWWVWAGGAAVLAGVAAAVAIGSGGGSDAPTTGTGTLVLEPEAGR